MDKVKVLIVDDHEVVRIGLTTLLRRQPWLEVVGEAGTAGEAVQQAFRLAPDVVVMDVRLPDRSGVEACREIREAFPRTHVIMLTSYSDDEAVMSSIMAGASGYVLKEIGSSGLVSAIEAVTNGRSLLDPVTTAKVLERLRKLADSSQAENQLDALSRREKEILGLISQGKSNREIGEILHLSESTVKHHVTNIFSKLGLNNRAQAAVYGLKHRPGD